MRIHRGILFNQIFTRIESVQLFVLFFFRFCEHFVLRVAWRNESLTWLNSHMSLTQSAMVGTPAASYVSLDIWITDCFDVWMKSLGVWEGTFTDSKYRMTMTQLLIKDLTNAHFKSRVNQCMSTRYILCKQKIHKHPHGNMEEVHIQAKIRTYD